MNNIFSASYSFSQGLHMVVLIVVSQNLFLLDILYVFLIRFLTISSVPLPWWTSKSIIAILLMCSLYLYLQYAAPIAILLKKQKPFEEWKCLSTVLI